MAWPLQYLPCKREDLSSIHKTHIEKHVGVGAHVCNPSDGEKETGVSLGPASWNV